jgi:hypothetical protein
VSAVRASHDRLAGIVAGLDGDALRAQSYDTEWSVADVLSHLGSGAEIFSLHVDAGVTGGDPPQREGFHVVMFGRMPLDLPGVLGLRLSEHAVHAWDVAVTLDPAAKVAPDAVDLLIDRLPMLAGFLGKQAPAPVAVAVTTVGPQRAFTLDTGGVTLAPAGEDDATAAALALPAEALLRLVYGRLDDEQDLQASGVTLTELKSVFPGF